MGVNSINWTASALASAVMAAVACLLTAFFAREGALFSAAIASGIGVVAVGAYAALALRQADRRLAKLSGELTVLSERLVRLENRGSQSDAAATVQDDVDGLARATGALADALDDQDAKLRALEQRIAAMDAKPAEASSHPAAPNTTPALAMSAPMPSRPTPAMHIQTPDLPRLTTREDFAKAANAILGRLSQPPVAAVLPPPPPPIRSIPTPSADERILKAIDEESLELWIQPIVTLPQRRARLYLALPHLREEDGSLLGPDMLRPVLSSHRRLARLDAFALHLSLTVAGHLSARGSETALCLPLSRQALATPGFIEGAASRLAEDPVAAGLLVLALDHADVETMSSQETSALERLRSLGAGLAMTSVPNLDRDWAALSRRGFDYATLSIDDILSPRPHTTTAFLVAEAARAGVALAAAGVDDERQVPDLLDFDVPLACGLALAPARPVRAEALAPRAEVPPPPPPKGDGPASFRDFLRRVG